VTRQPHGSLGDRLLENALGYPRSSGAMEPKTFDVIMHIAGRSTTWLQLFERIFHGTAIGFQEPGRRRIVSRGRGR
jgi:hypothetical protein